MNMEAIKEALEHGEVDAARASLRELVAKDPDNYTA